MTDYADLEIGLHRRDADSYGIELRFIQPESDADVRLVQGGPSLARFDLDRLRTLQVDDVAYGQLLGESLLADPDVKTAFAQTRSNAQSLDAPLRMRLFIGPSAPELHSLRWETLRDPDDGSPLLTGEQILFSRYLSSLDWRPVRLRPQAELRALVVIANPACLDDYRLTPVDVEGELERAKSGLDGIPITALASGGDATLNNIGAHLRGGYDILYLICHGALTEGEPKLWLEDQAGNVAVAAGSELVTRLKELRQRPRLVVLASCQSAGTGADTRSSDEGALTALGPRLAEAGIPAVLAMQGNVAMQTVAQFMPVFFRELQRDGRIDRAMAVARGAVRERPDWWVPTLFTRLKSGRLWEPEPEFPPPPEPTSPPAVIGFVGREAELAYCAGKLATAHLVIVTGMAGVGKTWLAAALVRQVADADKTFWHAFHEGEGIEAIIWKLAGFLAWHGQEDLWRMLQGARQTGGQPPPVEVLFDYLFQMLRGQEYLLCLDDLQYVDDDPLLAQLVERLRQPVGVGELSLVITSRRMPEFVPATEFEALAGLIPADAHDLLVDRGLALSDELVAELYTHIEGNAQLLTLAIEGLKRAGDPARMIAHLAESEDIERYLMSEVDAGLTEEEREVMSGVAVLLGYPGTRDAIEAILDGGSVRRTLHDMSDRHLLTVRQGAAQKEYDEHAMVQAFYYDLLGRRERRAMHRRAAEYYESEEPDTLKAALHCERAGEYERAVELATADVQALINQGQARALDQLLERLTDQPLPPSIRANAHEARGDLQYLMGELGEAIRQYEMAGEPLAEALTRARLHRKQGDVLARKGEYDEALDSLTRGRNLLAGADAATAEDARLAVVYGTVLLALGRYDDTAMSAQTALDQLPEPAANARIAADLHDLLGKVHFYKGQPAQSLAQFRAALERRQLASDQQGILKSYSNLAVVYGQQNRYADALQANESALAVAERIGDVVALDVLYGNMAADAMEQGAYEQAIEFNNLSLALCQKMGNTQGLWKAHNNLGEVYRRMERLDLAEEYLSRAIAVADQVGYQSGVVLSTQTLAEVYLSQDRLEEALARCQESLRLAERIGDQVWRPWGLRLLGRIRHRLRQWERARPAFAEASHVLREREARIDLANTLLHWARLEHDARQVGRARELCAEAATLADQTGADDLLKQATVLLSDLESGDAPGKEEVK